MMSDRLSIQLVWQTLRVVFALNEFTKCGKLQNVDLYEYLYSWNENFLVDDSSRYVLSHFIN